MVTFRTTLALLCLTITLIIPTINTGPPARAEFIPCRIVNLTLTPPALVEAGQPFQVTSKLTISCDPSVMPVVRVDLLEASTSKILSTISQPYYSYTSSFIISITNQATAPQSVGGWDLEVSAYVINEINGQSVAQTSQLFQVNIEPYTATTTSSQTLQVITQTSPITASTITYQTLPATASQQANTGAVTSTTPITFTPQTAGTNPEDFVLPALILLAGVVVFLFFMFAGRRRAEQPFGLVRHCWQCGNVLNQNDNYCTKCGTSQNK
jgi:hypothetical protein